MYVLMSVITAILLILTYYFLLFLELCDCEDDFVFLVSIGPLVCLHELYSLILVSLVVKYV